MTQGVSKHCINAPGYQAAIGLPSATRLDSKFPRLGAALLPSGHRFTVRDPSGLEVSPARCRLDLFQSAPRHRAGKFAGLVATGGWVAS